MRPLVLLVAGALALGGCVVDRTGRSGSYLLEQRVDSTRTRVHAAEKDISLQIARVDDMEEKAANARQRLADSGATFETFLEEMQALRGDLDDLRHVLNEGREESGAVAFRLGALEARLTHMEKELKVTPPLILPPALSPTPKGSTSRLDPPGTTSSAARASTVPVVASEPALGRSDTVIVENEQPTDEDALFQSALLAVKKKDWETAGTRLQRFLKEHPEGQRAVEAQFLVAQCLFELGRFKGAITTWQKVIERGPSTEWAPKAMFMQGLSFEELGTPDDIEAARVFFSELARLYPDSPDAQRAKVKMEALVAP